MKESRNTTVVALVATFRRSCLVKRCIESISKQKNLPNLLLVSVDEESNTIVQKKVKEIDVLLKEILKDVRLEFKVIPNCRTKKCASGTWNSGIQYITEHFVLEQQKEPKNIFVAILDDDDTWESNHIELCKRKLTKDVEIVVSGIKRIENQKEINLKIPQSIKKNDFFAGNPHVQGSNMFIRLDLIAKAGMFDENLESCTDRDLMIRICEMNPVFAYITNHWTVNHFAEDNRDRLSSPKSKRKRNGLVAFFLKHCGRMNKVERENCLRRSKEFFQIDIEKEMTKKNQKNSNRKNKEENRTPIEVPIEKNEKSKQLNRKMLRIIVGVTTDATSKRIRNLFDTLKQISQNRIVQSLFVVVLENDSSGKTENQMNPLTELIKEYELEINIVFISRFKQKQDARTKIFEDYVCREILFGKKRLSIAIMRTLTQLYTYQVSKTLNSLLIKNQVFWILDDDKFLNNNEKTINKFLFSLQELVYDTKYDILLGYDLFIPPLPALTSLRTQLIDLLYSYYHHQNLQIKKKPESYFYSFLDYNNDFSDLNYKNLEFPCFQHFQSKENKLQEDFEQIIHGRHPFRRENLGGKNEENCIYRGGNMMIISRSPQKEGNEKMNIEELLLTPNYSVQLNDGRYCRRSDFIWMILNKKKNLKSLKTPLISMIHHRSDAKKLSIDSFFDLEKDILGHSMYKALEKYKQEKERKKGNDGKEGNFIDWFYYFLKKRISKVYLNLLRIHGLLKIIQEIPLFSSIFKHEQVISLFFPEKIRSFIFNIFQRINSSSLFAFFDKITAFQKKKFHDFKLCDHSVIERFANYFQTNFRVSKTQKILSSIPHHQISPYISKEEKEEEKEEVKTVKEREKREKREFFKVIGIGKEGIVYCFEDWCFKVMDIYNSRTTEREKQKNIKTLKKLIRKWGKNKQFRLNRIEEIIEFKNYIIIVSPYIKNGEIFNTITHHHSNIHPHCRREFGDEFAR